MHAPQGSGLFVVPGEHPGLMVTGNIDLANRPTVHNRDGSISTVRSVTFTIDGGRALLLPTVVDGKVVSPGAALRAYQRTGQHLGVFASDEAAEAYARKLHEQQALMYLTKR